MSDLAETFGGSLALQLVFAAALGAGALLVVFGRRRSRNGLLALGLAIGAGGLAGFAIRLWRQIELRGMQVEELLQASGWEKYPLIAACALAIAAGAIAAWQRSRALAVVCLVVLSLLPTLGAIGWYLSAARSTEAVEMLRSGDLPPGPPDNRFVQLRLDAGDEPLPGPARPALADLALLEETAAQQARAPLYLALLLTVLGLPFGLAAALRVRKS
ncbi:MAG: hypothetical protein JXR96_17980 [Deltaproteobacteria bacterium]|nr:hypothetical protein [Deltaproteobacteria bacterium]